MDFSFGDVFLDNDLEAELEVKAIQFEGDAAVNNLRTRAATVRQRGSDAFTGSLFSAAGQALSAGAKFSDQQTARQVTSINTQFSATGFTRA